MNNMTLPPVALEPLLHKDDEGVTLEQRKLLALLLEEPSWQEACEQLRPGRGKEAEKDLRRWLSGNSAGHIAFRRAYDELGRSLRDAARAKLDGLMPKAADVYEEGLGAKQVELIWVMVPCPHPLACEEEEAEHRIQVAVPMPDLSTRLKVADNLFRRSGDLVSNNRQQVQMSGQVGISVSGGGPAGEVDSAVEKLSVEDRIALAMLSRGLPVPPDIHRSLAERRLLPLQLAAGSSAAAEAELRLPEDIEEGDFSLIPTSPPP